MSNTLKISTMTLIVAVASFMGCTTSGDLIEKVTGQWSGTTTEFDKSTMIDGSYTPELRFDSAQGQQGGAVTVTAMVDVTMPIDAPIDSVGTTAVSATASGIATFSGTWQAQDGNKMTLHFDMATLVVDVDPDVNFEMANVFTSVDNPSEQKVPASVYKAFEKQMTEGITASFKNLTDISDIQIKDGMMTCRYQGAQHDFNRVFE